MNFSETAFIYPEKKGFRLRWFTPLTEVDLCGHATLASAHILWEQHILKFSETAVFYTRSGKLTAEKSKDWILMDFPAEPAEKVKSHPLLLKGLGKTPIFTGKNRMDYLAVFSEETDIVRMKPDFKILERLNARGVIVTAASRHKKYDFVSRFFGPRVGINEDPVTGSAHCCLGPYWASMLNKRELLGYQASSRGGLLRVEIKKTRVLLGGKAVTIRLIPLEIAK